MAQGLSGPAARAALFAAKEASGPQYARILQQAGLERYVDTIPPEGEAVTITGEEAVRFQQTVYRMLGEDLFRLFHRNFGRSGGQGLLQSTWGPHLQATVATIPLDQRLAWLVGQYVGLAAHNGGHYTVTEDATAWYLESDDCTECPGIQGAKSPICDTFAGVFKTLADQILGTHVRVTEVACRAVDAPRCKNAIYKK
jgi:hypothetical protein